MLLPTSKLTLKTEISDQEGRLNKLVCSVSMQAEWRNFCLEKTCVEDERGGPICIYYVHEQRVGWIEPLLPKLRYAMTDFVNELDMLTEQF